MRARAAAIAAPHEATASFVAGCGLGPAAIAERLDALAAADTEPVRYPQQTPLSWVEAHDRTVVDPAEMIRLVSRLVREFHDAGVFPIVVGGEHTVAAGALEAIDDPGSATVVQFDAHADLRAEYEGSPWSHACAMRRALDRGHPIVQIGVRSACIEEIRDVYGGDARGPAGFLEAPSGRACMLTRSGLRDLGLGRVIDRIGPLVHVTIDLDVLDPSCAPGVGTPEPDGLSFAELIGALDAVLAGRTAASADVVEMCPPRDDGRTALVAARLVRFLAAAGRPPR